jgi:hypothetical protein
MESRNSALRGIENKRKNTTANEKTSLFDRFTDKLISDEFMKPFIKFIFKVLAKLNKIILPRYSKKDLSKLSKIDKLIIGYRYYVTKNSL